MTTYNEWERFTEGRAALAKVLVEDLETRHAYEANIAFVLEQHGLTNHNANMAARDALVTLFGIPTMSPAVDVLTGLQAPRVTRIGRVRRALMVPWPSRWNALVRDVTACFG
jgi:hypothetical protein